MCLVGAHTIIVCQIRPGLWWTAWKTTDMYLKCTFILRHDVPYSADLATDSKHCSQTVSGSSDLLQIKWMAIKLSHM